jgi:hypothetical protein
MEAVSTEVGQKYLPIDDPHLCRPPGQLLVASAATAGMPATLMSSGETLILVRIIGRDRLSDISLHRRRSRALPH